MLITTSYDNVIFTSSYLCQAHKSNLNLYTLFECSNSRAFLYMVKPYNPPEKALFPLYISNFSTLYCQMLAKKCVSPLKVEQEAKTRLRTHFQNVERCNNSTITCLPLQPKIIRKNEDIAELQRGSLHWKNFFPTFIFMQFHQIKGMSCVSIADRVIHFTQITRNNFKI